MTSKNQSGHSIETLMNTFNRYQSWYGTAHKKQAPRRKHQKTAEEKLLERIPAIQHIRAHKGMTDVINNLMNTRSANQGR